MELYDVSNELLHMYYHYSTDTIAVFLSVQYYDNLLLAVYDLKAGHVGSPISCARVKLVDWEEGKYRVTDNPPSGEVWLGGPANAMGYFKNPEKTAEDFVVEDGVK